MLKPLRVKSKHVPSFIHLCTLGSKTQLLCSASCTGFPCSPAGTAARLIYRDLFHTSVYLLGAALMPCSYLSKSIKSACDCTWHLWFGLDVNSWGKAVCELFNLLSIPGPCIKSIKQYGAFSCLKRRPVSALLELSESWVFWALNFISLYHDCSAIMGDQCKQYLLPDGPEIFLINLLFSSLLSFLLFSSNLVLLDETGWGNASRIILWLGHLALKSGDQCLFLLPSLASCSCGEIACTSVPLSSPEK